MIPPTPTLSPPPSPHSPPPSPPVRNIPAACATYICVLTKFRVVEQLLDCWLFSVQIDEVLVYSKLYREGSKPVYLTKDLPHIQQLVVTACGDILTWSVAFLYNVLSFICRQNSPHKLSFSTAQHSLLVLNRSLKHQPFII